MENEKKEFKKELDLDDVLTNELGEFGWFQIRNLLLVCIQIIVSAFLSDYIFTALAIPHRCRIPECGIETKLQVYDPSWIAKAIPETDTGFSSCERFLPQGGNGPSALTTCSTKTKLLNAMILCIHHFMEETKIVTIGLSRNYLQMAIPNTLFEAFQRL